MTVSILVEYLWCSGTNTHHDIRSKIKVMSLSKKDVPASGSDCSSLLSKLSEWNFDGSSTGQAKGRDTEIELRPIAVWPHPFIKDTPAFVALAECYYPNGEPTKDNTRAMAREVFEATEAKGQAPWFGLEQEYVLYSKGTPLGWPTDGRPPAPQGPYYCGTGALVAFGREYAERHLQLCVAMGLKLSGLNAEVMPGQWEYQVGPCEGIEAGDHALMARWVYLRMLEQAGVDINFDSKPKAGDWNGSGMHTNFSTASMRAEGGMKEIETALKRLGEDPFRELAAYGADNNERMTGAHETSTLEKFDYDVGSRNTSARIPNAVKNSGRGYFEDRRPSSSADPYLATARIFATSCAIPSPKLDAHCEGNLPFWLKDLRERLGPQLRQQQRQ